MTLIAGIGIGVESETEIVGVSGKLIEGMEVGETVMSGIGGVEAPFTWIDGESGS
jgi:hypothetical protein